MFVVSHLVRDKETHMLRKEQMYCCTAYAHVAERANVLLYCLRISCGKSKCIAVKHRDIPTIKRRCSNFRLKSLQSLKRGILDNATVASWIHRTVVCNLAPKRWSAFARRTSRMRMPSSSPSCLRARESSSESVSVGQCGSIRLKHLSIRTTAVIPCWKLRISMR